MVNLGAWIASLVPSLVARVLAALGFGIATVAGVTAAFDAIRVEVYSNLGALPVSMLELAGLSGAGDAIAVIFGAISARVAFYVATASRRLIGLGS